MTPEAKKDGGAYVLGRARKLALSIVNEPRRMPLREGVNLAPTPVPSRPAVVVSGRTHGDDVATKKTEKPAQRRDALSLKDDVRRCKARPTHTRGNGASRKFVPWCK